MAEEGFSRFPVPLAEPSERWVRVRLGGETVADSRRPVLLLQYGPGRLPAYFFPAESVRTDLLTAPEGRDGVRRWTVRAGGREARGAAWAYAEPPAGLEALAGYITFDWGAMDEWLEEDEAVHVHARDPHKRVDVMASSRHVEVSVGGEVIADSRRPRLLFETQYEHANVCTCSAIGCRSSLTTSGTLGSPRPLIGGECRSR